MYKYELETQSKLTQNILLISKPISNGVTLFGFHNFMKDLYFKLYFRLSAWNYIQILNGDLLSSECLKSYSNLITNSSDSFPNLEFQSNDFFTL